MSNEIPDVGSCTIKPVQLCTCCEECGIVYNAAEPGSECKVCQCTIKIAILESFEQRQFRTASYETLTQMIDEFSDEG